MKKSAEFSDCRKYRYVLWRIWDETRPYAVFVGLNPSTADETNDDPTVMRCINYAKLWGYGGLCMVNLFAYRATNPNMMMVEKDPVGGGNDQWLLEVTQNAGVVVAAWGNGGCHLNRSKQVIRLLKNLHFLKLNQSGEPSHPLYLKANLQPSLMMT